MSQNIHYIKLIVASARQSNAHETLPDFHTALAAAGDFKVRFGHAAVVVSGPSRWCRWELISRPKKFSR